MMFLTLTLWPKMAWARTWYFTNTSCFHIFSRGVARTQVMLMPRSVNKKPSQSSKPASSQQTAESSSSVTQSDSKDSKKSTGMSNSDFRNMLLKKWKLSQSKFLWRGKMILIIWEKWLSCSRFRKTGPDGFCEEYKGCNIWTNLNFVTEFCFQIHFLTNTWKNASSIVYVKLWQM